MAKMGFIFARDPHGCDVALRPHGSATRAHAVPTRHDVTCALCMFTIYIGYNTYKHAIVWI